MSTYVDPADRVASTKVNDADTIATWSVSEVDKKGKKMKGTLGIGKGAVFFASETSKACHLIHLYSYLANAVVHRPLFKGGPRPILLTFLSKSLNICISM